MATDTESREDAEKRAESSLTARYIAATVRAQAGWRGWTQRDIARETGLRPNYISERWRGEREWSFADVERIARALNMDSWMFFDLARSLSVSSVALRAPENQDDATETDTPVDLRARNRP